MKLKHGDLICNAKDNSGLWVIIVDGGGITYTSCLIGNSSAIQVSGGLCTIPNPATDGVTRVLCNIAEIYDRIRDRSST